MCAIHIHARCSPVDLVGGSYSTTIAGRSTGLTDIRLSRIAHYKTEQCMLWMRSTDDRRWHMFRQRAGIQSQTIGQLYIVNSMHYSVSISRSPCRVPNQLIEEVWITLRTKPVSKLSISQKQ